MAQYKLKNPAYGNVPAQTIKTDIPVEGQVFKTGATSPLQIVKGGKIYTLSPESVLGTQQVRNARGGIDILPNWGQAQNTGGEWANYFGAAAKQLGVDINAIPLYKPGNVTTAYNAVNQDLSPADLATFKSYIQAGGQAPTEGGTLEGYVSPTLPNVKASAQVKAAGWQDPVTGQPTPAGVGMPSPSPNIPPPGATYITDPAELKGLTEEQIWRDPNSQKIYKLKQATLTSPEGKKEVVAVGSAKANQLLAAGYTLGDKIGGGTMVTSDLLAGQADIDIGKDLPQNNVLADQVAAGIQSDVSSAQAQIQKNVELAKKPESDLDRQYQELLNQLDPESVVAGRAAMQQAEEEKRQIEEKNQLVLDKTTELEKKLAEINSLTKSYELENQKLEGVPMTLSSLRGQQAQNYKMYIAQKNLLTSDAAYLQVELLGLQNKLTQAQAAADKAVELEYADRLAVYNAKISKLNLLIPQLDKEDKEYATGLQMYLQQHLDATEEEKQTKKDIQSAKLTAISSGITDSNILSQIGNAGSYDEALQILGENMPIRPTESKFTVIGQDEEGSNIYGFVDETGKAVTPYRPGGGIVTDASGASYDIASYATDPNHEASVQGILNNIGQMTSWEQMDEYIQSVAPGSPVTGEMIGRASEKYEVSWEAIMAIMQQDSNFGTLGAGARSHNPGNVGNTELATSTGQLVDFGTWQAGVDAVAKNLAWRKTSVAQPQVDPEVQGYVELVQSGQLKPEQALDDINKKKKDDLVVALAQTPPTKEKLQDVLAKEKAELAISLKEHPGLNESVGPTGLTRIDWWPFSGAKQEFIGSVEQLVSDLSLESLIEAKSRGATFGALSDSEMQILASAATKIGTWRKRNKKGEVVGYKVSEKAFKAELDNINRTLLRGITPERQVMSDGTVWEVQSDGNLKLVE